MRKNIISSFIIIITATLLLNSCKAFKPDRDPISGKIIRKEPNLRTRAEETIKEGGGFFNSKNFQGSTTYDFATSNVMWRATLMSLDFMPLQSANYSGGILITDWYTGKLNSKESIKVEVRFLSNETSANSIKIISYKKTCENLNCKITKLNNNFNEKLKNSIMEKVREIKIDEETKKKKKG